MQCSWKHDRKSCSLLMEYPHDGPSALYLRKFFHRFHLPHLLIPYNNLFCPGPQPWPPLLQFPKPHVSAAKTRDAVSLRWTWMWVLFLYLGAHFSYLIFPSRVFVIVVTPRQTINEGSLFSHQGEVVYKRAAPTLLPLGPNSRYVSRRLMVIN